MRSVSLGIAFECERLFAFGTIEGLGSREDAEAILAAWVTLAVEDHEVLMRSGNFTAHRGAPS
jgi:hypothetical protein